jgi:hypothetical protein
MGCWFLAGARLIKNLTQSRLRPISPFSYVGQGRKGAKEESGEVTGEVMRPSVRARAMPRERGKSDSRVGEENS